MSTEESVEDGKTPERALPVNVKWPPSLDLPLLYANFFAYMNTGHEVVLTFGEFLPYLQDPDREDTRDFLENAYIKPVARIAMSPTGLDALYQMLKRLHDKESEDVSVNEDR